MPWDIQENHPKCPATKPWGVVKRDGELEGCHPTREAAKRQQAALYANEGDTMKSDLSVFMRSYPLEDIRILTRAQGSEYSDGRTVEAYAAVFDRPAEIRDHEGHYMEEIDPAGFNRAIEHARPQGGRSSWLTGVFFNHGLTLHGTPAAEFSKTLGTPLEIRAEPHGLLTITRYNKNRLADEVLEMINNGDIRGQSFSGKIKRSNPVKPPRQGYQPDRNGNLPTVRRLELGLNEYGPTPFPAYVDAAVVGVRALLAAGVTPAELMSVTRFDDDPADIDTSTDVELVPDDPPEGHSDRDPEMTRHKVLQRIASARRTRPGLAPKDDET